MTSEVEISHYAKLLYDRYGEDADVIAALRADRLLEFGELERHGTWIRILRALAELRSEASKTNNTIH